MKIWYQISEEDGAVEGSVHKFSLTNRKTCS